MTKQFCDRCVADITDKTSGAVRGIAEADAHGNGTITLDAALCRRCYRDLNAWLTQRVPARTTRTRTQEKRR
jgi:hypothetical protein